MQKPEIQKLQDDIDNLKRELRYEQDERKNFRSLFDAHQHQGQDKSSLTEGKPNLSVSTISVTGGAPTLGGTAVHSPFSIFDVNNDLTYSKTALSQAILTTLAPRSGTSVIVVGTTTEIVGGIIAGKIPNDTVSINDFTRFNQMQLIMQHYPDGEEDPPYAFLTGIRTPIIISQGSTGAITQGASTLTDTANLSLATNSLAGCAIVLQNAAKSTLEAYTIASNTATVITINGTWANATASYDYYVFTPVFFGSAQTPWRRLYSANDIRFGYGATDGGQTWRLNAYEDNPLLSDGFSLQVNTNMTFVGTTGGSNVKCASINTGAGSTSDPRQGQFTTIIGRNTLSGGNTVEFNTNTTNLKLSASSGTQTFIMGAYDTLSLSFDQLGQVWVETSRSNN